MKRALKRAVVIVGIPRIYFIYLIYLGENRLALLLNQRTSVPEDLTDITITSRSGLLCGGFGVATCKTAKSSFIKWIDEYNFDCFHEITIKPDSLPWLDKLPKDFLNDNNKQYDIQLKHSRRDFWHVRVMPVDSENVSLRFVTEWF